MDINQIPGEMSRAVHQRLLSNPAFDAFVLERLWHRLSLRTKEVLECSKTWYFGEIQATESWRIPALVIVFRNGALLAQIHYANNLWEIANSCKALTGCDRVQVMGSDTCFRLWFDHNAQQWHRQTLPLPADWQPEEG